MRRLPLPSVLTLFAIGGLVAVSCVPTASPVPVASTAPACRVVNVVDGDTVDESNLQRQVLHGLDRVGEAKVESGKRTIENLNPDVNVIAFNERLTRQNVDRIFDQDWDVIVDGETVRRWFRDTVPMPVDEQRQLASRFMEMASSLA